MYAVIRTGGKQYRVEPGEQLDVELLGAIDDELELAPLFLVDGERVLCGPTALAGAVVKARIVADARGPKINGFTYKAKTRQRRRWGHRQHLSRLEITAIETGES
jgi:large subunit ribosomal protein L21